MADIPILQVTVAGEQPLALATGDGADWTIEANDGNILIELQNPTGATLHATFKPVATGPGGLSFSNKIVTVPAGETIWCGAWPPVIYNDDSQRVTVTLDAGLLARGVQI